MTAVIEAVATDALVRIRDEAQRLVDVELAPWGAVARHTEDGPETFDRGAFAAVDPSRIRLRVGSHRDRSVGVGVSLTEDDDRPRVTFRVAKTRAGDDALAELADGVYRDASVGFIPRESSVVDGVVHRKRADLPHVAIVEAGAYGSDATVVALRESSETKPAEPAPEPAEDDDEDGEDEDEHEDEGDTTVTDTATTTPDVPAPDAGQAPAERSMGEWAALRIRAIDGDRIAERALSDITTAGNAGVVPTFHMTELVGIIDASRPLLGGLRRLPTPAYGMKLDMPVIGTRPVTDKQTAEKAEIASGPVTTTIQEIAAATYAGGGDLSIQILRRSSPSFLALYVDLLAEALSADMEAGMLAVLSTAIGAAGTIDPADPTTYRGASWSKTFAAVKRAPDRLFLSPSGVGAFLDAQDGTGRPLYPSLGAGSVNGTGSASIATGLGTVDGLVPIVCPVMEGSAYDAIIGWSGGAVWAEDGAFELAVDVPAKLGRDIALATIAWFGVIYPGAFSGYKLTPPTPLGRSSSKSAA
jgi:phage head maturation protease